MPRLCFANKSNIWWAFVILAGVLGCGSPDSSSGSDAGGDMDASGEPDAGGDPVADGDPDDASDAGITVETVEILRDQFGVPHVFAPSYAAATYGWGYAASEDVKGINLIQFHSAVGQSYARFGAWCDGDSDCAQQLLILDAFANIHDIPGVVATGYEKLAPNTRAVLSAFATGINDYAATRISWWDPSMELTGETIAATYLQFRILQQRNSSPVTNRYPGESNQFAVTGARTPANTTIVEKDPHTGWGQSQLYVHLHFNGLDVVGHHNGFPDIRGGGNSNVSWGITNAGPVAAVLVEADASYVRDDDDGSASDHTACTRTGITPPMTVREATSRYPPAASRSALLQRQRLLRNLSLRTSGSDARVSEPAGVEQPDLSHAGDDPRQPGEPGSREADRHRHQSRARTVLEYRTESGP